jgi:hypothetical protein
MINTGEDNPRYDSEEYRKAVEFFKKSMFGVENARRVLARQVREERKLYFKHRSRGICRP